MSSSARGYNWLEPVLEQKEIVTYARATGLEEPVAALLLRRNVAEEDVDGFLSPTLKATLPNPSSLKDMDEATSIIAEAILSGRKTVVLADYDVDGATSAAQLITYFRHFGRDLGLYVPDRLKEGYGPSPAAFEQLKSEGAELVITVDCGAAAESALSHGASIGLDVVVVDHHLMHGEIPKCSALVNPNRPDCTSGQGHLAAAGVVFLLLVSLNRYFRTHAETDAKPLPDLLDWLDLCSLGTLCDMAPLQGVNRTFVIQGLKQFKSKFRPGIEALCHVSGRSQPERVTDLTFGLGPQLNAGGRIGDPWLATKLLVSERLDQAVPIAESLAQLNHERKVQEQDILSRARRDAERQLETAPDLPILVLDQEGWHPGIIGIVAGRIKDEFHRPALVIGWGEDFGDLAKGSARSVAGINIGDVISKAREEGLLRAGGGHAMAGGLSVDVEKVTELRKYLIEALKDVTTELDQARDIQIDFDILCSALNLPFIDTLERAGPYGAASPKPLLRIKSAHITMRRDIGTNHVKVFLDDGSAKLDAVAWRCADSALGEILQRNRLVDVVGYAERNTWQGRDSVQFEIIDAIARN